DAEGNVATHSFTVSVQADGENPIVICQDISITLNTSGNASITTVDINNGSTDNCGIASISLDKYNFTCSDLGDNTVTLTVIDTAGNVSTCTSIVTVESPTEDASVTIASNDPNDEICSGSSITFTATPINGGTTQYYEWFINGISEGTTVAPTFTPNTTPTSNFEIYVRRTTDITACGPIQSPTLNITVIPPPVISFPSEVCIGRNTYQLTPSSGGTWTSNNTNIATITPNSGVITGLAPGSVTFTYVSPSTGCSITTDPIILNPLRTINAPATMCVGETYGLSPSTGGRWLSSDTRIATIIEETGVITAVGPGTVVFRFIDRTTGCTSYSSQTEVQEISIIRSITASNDPICAGDPTILTSIVQGTGNYAETLVNYTFDSGNDYSELIDHSTTPGINSSFSSPSDENNIPFNTAVGTPGGFFTNNPAEGRSLRQIDDWRDGGIYGGTDDSGDWLLNVDGPALVNYQNLRVSFQYRRGSRFGEHKYIIVDYRVGNSGAWTSNTVYVQKGNAYFTNKWIYATFSLPPSFDNVSSIQFRLSVDDGSTFNPCTIGSDGCPDGATAIAEPHIYIDNLQVQGSAFDDSVAHSWSANTGTAAGLPTSATIPSINNDIITVNPEVTTEYTLTVTNSNGCETTETVTVNVHPSPEIIINADYCPEDDPSTPDRDESNMVQLIASANQSITSWEWNTGETGHTIYVDTAGQYQVIGTTVNGCSQAVTIQVAQELVVNGDFSLGNSDFDSDYTYYANLQNVNGYAITTDGNTVSPDFYGPDHTDGTGNFMAVNSNGSSNVVWRQTVNVEAGVEYFFSAWARSLNASGLFGKLAFRVNGIQMGAQLDLDAYPTNDWSRFNGTWTSTVDGAILIEIINNEPSPVENNFGIDDISFATLSTFINLTSHIGSIDQTVCENMPIETITYEVGGGLTGPTITGLPAGLDTTFDGLVFTISGIPTESGTFNYTIDINASCGNKTASGVIVVNPAPVVTITTPSQTICQSEGTITLSATLSGSATGGTWTTNGTGNFTPSATDPNATYNFGSAETGDITLTFTSNNPDGPCEATVETLDIEITPYIIATVGENQTTANCDINTVTLTGNNVIGQWTASPNTGYFSDPSVYNSTFTGESGETYTLTWTATNTGVCTDNTTATMTVTIPDCGTNLVFNGVNEYINFGDHYNLSGPFSIEAWIKPANVTGTKTIISKRNGTALTDGYDLSLIGNRLYFRYNNINAAINATQDMSPNQWYHVAVTFDGSNYNLYIDGFFLRTVSGSAPTSSSNRALIGAMDRTNNLPINYFNGGIDEVRIWNTALTETQIREMMNQEIEAHGTNVRGVVIPMDIAGLQWSNLRGYYQMNTGSQTNVASGVIQNITSIPVPGTLNGMTSDQEETAPIPYRSIADSNWDSPTTWSAESVQQIPNSVINNIRPGLYQTWNIVRTANNITAENKNFTVLGLFIDANKLAIQNSDPLNGHSLEVTKYLNIAEDAILDLVGESQLLQGEGSILGPGTGVLERDQQGTGNMFNYNYWGSPVTNAETAGERTYSLSGILFDGNDLVQWTGGLNGSQTSPVTLSTRWLYTFENRDFDDYNGWNRITQNTAIKVGLGFLMKGTGLQGSLDQNYTFRGRPNNGDITITINPSELTTLLGNPYPSAIDASEFIKENETSLKEGTLIFWEQAPSNNSHYLAAYQGRYSYLNMLGGLSAATPPGIANSGDATKEPKNAVPVGQGFFVTGSYDGGDVIFKNSHRIFVTETSGGSVFLRNSEDSTKILKTQGEAPLHEDNIQRVRFAFTTPENATRHLLLGFTPDNDATDGIDYGYDASNSDDFPSDLSFAIEGRKFVIQGVGSFDINKKYPLDMTLGITGNVELALTGLENFEETIDVYVHDALLDTYTRINTVGFQANLEAGNYSGRFSIVFRPDSTLSNIDQ
ncbi:LamG domain-containing protein, partial [Gelidibacter japonicus]|uniref:LamG domain-containing protein n=1 Tax=Gelidibacter japonicus TaxID=1962232 RepID=UPI002020FF51